MNNSVTIDRRDVAHPTNPLGSHEAIEQEDFALAPDEVPSRPASAQVSARPESKAYTASQVANVPPASSPGMPLVSLEQPVEGAENKLRVDARDGRLEVAEPAPTEQRPD